MITKTIEIRDAGTFIPAVAIKVKPDNAGERYLIRRAGYGSMSDCTILCKLECSGISYNATYDPYSWGTNRSMLIAHQFLEEHFDDVKDGDVIDVEFILGETKTPKVSESVTYPI